MWSREKHYSKEINDQSLFQDGFKYEQARLIKEKLSNVKET
jgi:hypothetical protein